MYNEPINHTPTDSLGKTIVFKSKPDTIKIKWITGERAKNTNSTSKYTLSEFNTQLTNGTLQRNNVAIEDKRGYQDAIAEFCTANKTTPPQEGQTVTVPRKYASTLRALYWIDFTDSLIDNNTISNRGIQTLSLYQHLSPLISPSEFNSHLQQKDGFTFTTNAVHFDTYNGSLSTETLLHKYALAIKLTHIAETRLRSQYNTYPSGTITAGLLTVDNTTTPGLVIPQKDSAAKTHIQTLLTNHNIDYAEPSQSLGSYTLSLHPPDVL